MMICAVYQENSPFNFQRYSGNTTLPSKDKVSFLKIDYGVFKTSEKGTWKGQSLCVDPEPDETACPMEMSSDDGNRRQIVEYL